MRTKGLRNCTHSNIMNDIVDKLANFAFDRAVQLQNAIDPDFPCEKLRVKQNRKKINGNICREIDNLIGERTAKRNFAKSDRISRENFQKVWWDGMYNLIKSYPQMSWMVSHVPLVRKRD